MIWSRIWFRVFLMEFMQPRDWDGLNRGPYGSIATIPPCHLPPPSVWLLLSHFGHHFSHTARFLAFTKHLHLESYAKSVRKVDDAISPFEIVTWCMLC